MREHNSPMQEPEAVYLESPLWYVVMTLAGQPVNVAQLSKRLERFGTDCVFASALRYRADRVEISYWDEAPVMSDALEAALASVSETKRILKLPGWDVVALEVLDRWSVRDRSSRGRGPELLVPGELRAW